MADLQLVARTCNEIAEANGFERPTWDNIVAKLAYAGTELDEARDGVLGTGADPLSEELADTAIRLLSVIEAIWGNDWNDRVTQRSPKVVNPYSAIETLLWPTLGYIFKAMESRRHEDRIEVRTCIELSLLELWRLADALKIDLDSEIEAKCEKNRKRPLLHGKKCAAG